MSINALANAAAARRPDLPPFETVPQNIAEIARAAATPPEPTAAPPPGEPAALSPTNAVNTAMNVLFGYIPTEVLTLYVAVVAAIQKPAAVTIPEWIAFWSFLVITPIVVWLVYAAKVKAAQRPVSVTFQSCPVWEMFAATVAFFGWAFALPDSPFTAFPEWYSSALGGIAVLVTSTFLGLLAPFFQRPLSP